jgi:hypothetical protein
MSKIKSTRHAPGSYVVTDGVNEVDVYKVEFDDGEWWVASCFVNHSDPVNTYREARKNAVYILENWKELAAI